MRKVFRHLISFLGVLGLCIAFTNSAAIASSNGDTDVGIRFTTESTSGSSDIPPTTDTPTDTNQENKTQQPTGKLPQTGENHQWVFAFSGASILVVLGLIVLHRESEEK